MDDACSCGHPIERVERSGEGEARIIFRSPYSVLSILSGQPHAELILDDGQSIIVCAQEHFFQDNNQRKRCLMLTRCYLLHLNEKIHNECECSNEKA
ncbi:hypothetical protein RchiOBHm_Chr5g0003111 [Rosa chinensis]|uniref:Uncharacterized protein n=1 Tax=Rosa chinensis TaxID=74649 RepID=A0A2P6Q2R1_ROSCH|nr:hypothetical protein RchiOBHm_Chr5g0003111 [Rosa chinensis]